jgi:hypothetical protein
MANETIQDGIEQAAIDGVASAVIDGNSVTGIPLKDRIAADQYLTAKDAKAKNHLGLSFRRFEPGGTG